MPLLQKYRGLYGSRLELLMKKRYSLKPADNQLRTAKKKSVVQSAEQIPCPTCDYPFAGELTAWRGDITMANA